MYIILIRRLYEGLDTLTAPIYTPNLLIRFVIQTMGQLPSAALPSLERILTHAKSDREKKIREMEEKHRQKDASKSSYEKV